MKVAPARQALDFGERPDPAAGIFETILVQDGQAPLLAAHLERLRGSARELYGAELAAGLAWALGEIPEGTARVRATYVPGKALQIDHGPLAPGPAYEEIAPFVLPGGLGRHKWADRRLVGTLQEAAAGALALLIDADGAVLEATWASVLIEEDGRLVSPPDDGRALPGIGRSRLRYGEEPVDLDRLLAADAVVLTSALRTVRLPLHR